jgi:hypothetical protein
MMPFSIRSITCEASRQQCQQYTARCAGTRRRSSGSVRWDIWRNVPLQIAAQMMIDLSEVAKRCGTAHRVQALHLLLVAVLGQPACRGHGQHVELEG